MREKTWFHIYEEVCEEVESAQNKLQGLRVALAAELKPEKADLAYSYDMVQDLLIDLRMMKGQIEDLLNN